MPFSNFVRKIYDYIINLSSNKHALWWLFAISFIESSFFPIPPDIMLIPMILATPKQAWKIAGVCTIASVIGAYLGYVIGIFFFDLIAKHNAGNALTADNFHGRSYLFGQKCRYKY